MLVIASSIGIDSSTFVREAISARFAAAAFAAANIPMLMRHGLNLGEKLDSEEIGETTPPQG